MEQVVLSAWEVPFVSDRFLTKLTQNAEDYGPCPSYSFTATITGDQASLPLTVMVV